ncbi:MAG: tetratricopeptide repeat protein [Opitutae bacterium]
MFYWNARKAWFRLRGAARDDCPCQNASDSGLALETRCDAIIQWNQPARFRRICSLLKETPAGLRCSVEAERVRPFWGRAMVYVATSLLGIYLTMTCAAFLVLRAVHYDISYATVAWPMHWSRFRVAQENLYTQRATAALQAGNFPAAMLSLEMVCKLNPGNYGAGLTLARLSQAAGQSSVADHIYERLMRDAPDERIKTAQIWYRTLLGRGDYTKIIPLAAAMLSEDPAERGVWLYGLLFAARQSHDGRALGVVQQENPHLPEWCTNLIEAEQSLLEQQAGLALPLLTQVHRQPADPVIPFYQVERLLLSGHYAQAEKQLAAYSKVLPFDEAAFLRLRLDQAQGRRDLLRAEQSDLLRQPLSVRLAGKCCAYLIAQRRSEMAPPFLNLFIHAGPPLTEETVPLYQAAYLTAALAGETVHQEAIRAQLMHFTSSDTRVLHGIYQVLKPGKPDPQLARILPLVSLPLEVVYAILELPPAPPPP